MIKWQPVMLIVTDRVECGQCHALAVFIVLSEPTTAPDDATGTDKTDMTYSAYCQACFEQAQQDEEDENPLPSP